MQSNPELESLQLQIDYAQRKMQTIKDKLHWAEGARIDAEKLIAAGRGGYLRRPTQKLLSALKAIERELV